MWVLSLFTQELHIDLNIHYILIKHRELVNYMWTGRVDRSNWDGNMGAAIQIYRLTGKVTQTLIK